MNRAGEGNAGGTVADAATAIAVYRRMVDSARSDETAHG